MFNDLMKVMRERQGFFRADMTAADLANGGLLSPAQTKQFLDDMNNGVPMFKEARMEVMTASQHEISRMGIGERVLKAPPAENTAVASGKTVKPATGKTMLTAHQMRGEVPISYRVIRQNILKESFLNDVMRMIAVRCGVDIARNSINGDSSLTVSVSDEQDALRLYDGWRVKAASAGHPVDAVNATVDDDLLDTIEAAIPAKYIEGTPLEFRYYAQRDLGRNWRKFLAKRATPLGDAAMIEAAIMNHAGYPIIKDANFDSYTHSGDTCADVLFTYKGNLVVGLHQDVTIKMVDWPEKESVRFFIGAEVDAGFERPDAVALGKNIKILS